MSADARREQEDAQLAAELAQQEAEFRLDFRRLVLVSAVILATLLEIIDTSIVNVALPDMMGNLGVTLDQIDWVITGYIVSNVVVIPMTGWFATRFGRKRYFTASILVFTTASLFCGLSRTLPELVLFRVIQGLGGGALLSTSQAIMVETFPPSKQGIGQALFGVGVMIGPSLGPTLGGWITDNLSWPWIFFINVPLGLVAATLCGTVLRDPDYLRGHRGVRIDWAGIVCLVLGVACLQTVLERGQRDDWFASGTITLLAATAGTALVAFVVRELTAREPIVNLRVLRRRALAVGCGYAAILGSGLYGSVFLFPVYTESLLGWSAWQSGLGVLPSSIATAVTMLFVGRLLWRTGPRPIFASGLVMFLLALVGRSHWTLASGWNDIFWPQVARGIGTGAMFVPLATVTLRALPGADVPQGAGLYNLSRQLGGSFGIAILTTFLDRRADFHRHHLVSGMGPLNPVARLRLHQFAQGLHERGLDLASAHHAALAVLDRLVQAEAAMRSFQDVYRILIGIFLVALPFVLLLARHAPGKVVPAAR